jgi:hypothetical protein
MIDVGGNDGAPARDLVAHEFRRDRLRERGAKGLPRVLPAQEIREGVHALVLANRDELHLRRDRAAARIVHLRHVPTGDRATRFPDQVESQLRQLRVSGALAAIMRGGARKFFGVVSLEYPRRPQRLQSPPDIDLHHRVRVRARCVVDEDRRIGLGTRSGPTLSGRAGMKWRVRLADLAHRHADVGARARDVGLARVRQRLHCRLVNVRGRTQELGVGVHVRSMGMLRRRSDGGRIPSHASLRRHYPHQVQRVFLTGMSRQPSAFSRQQAFR